MTKEEALDILELLEHLRAYSDVEKILSTFMSPFFEKSTIREDNYYLHGSFHLGGTKSGRLSSSQPNLQQLPSTGSPYAKTIKKIFESPIDEKGKVKWVFVGADFSSLEDRIGALITKDPNKLKVYTDHYDGHCLRAYYYFRDQMPDIDPTSVKSINSIADKYPKLRQKSKTPTFALQYQGTNKTLQKNCGFDYETAVKIENNYHELYAVSDQVIKAKLLEASKKGYVELAFGLRLRTPMMAQVIMGSESTMPWETFKEMKTAANAIGGQSYGLLNTRAANEFMQCVWASPWAESILPSCQIHDSQYYLIENKLTCLKWVNDNLIDCMKWTDLPEIQHPDVKLEAELEVYYPNWSKSIKLPNNISALEISQLIEKAKHDH